MPPNVGALRGAELTIEIPLTRGHVAIIDIADYPLVAPYTWSFHAISAGRTAGYARTRRRQGGRMYMHRLILAAAADESVDHANGDGLDNRRANLRICTQAENNANCSAQVATSSEYKGVYRNPRDVWEAYIHADRHKTSLGYFRDEKDAARAYDLAARARWGEFALLNFPDEIVDPVAIEGSRAIAQRCLHTGETQGLCRRGGDGRCRRLTIAIDGYCWAHGA